MGIPVERIAADDEARHLVLAERNCGKAFCGSCPSGLKGHRLRRQRRGTGEEFAPTRTPELAARLDVTLELSIVFHFSPVR